jgi:hypothetical protein
VGESRLARAGRAEVPATSTQNTGSAGTRVRAPERTDLAKACLWLLGHQRVDLRAKDRLRWRERRQETGKAAGEHSLAASGRSQKEKVVAAGGSHLERSLGGLLSPYLREVGRGGRARRGGEWRGGPGSERLNSFQMLQSLREAVETDDGEALSRTGQGRRLRRTGGRQQQLAASETMAELSDREPAADRADGPVQAELSADQPAVQSFLWKGPRGHQDRERDGQVEGRCFLGEIGRGEIDDDGFAAELEAAASKGCPDPFAAFSDRVGVKPQDLGLSRAVVDQDFDVDDSGIDSPEGGGLGSGWT